jgi:hypothetical protein
VGKTMSEEKSLAERMFDGTFAEGELEEKLLDAGLDFLVDLRWDYYDGSLEIDSAPNDFRLSPEVQKIIFDSGFGMAYVNHEDKTETHYTWNCREFKPVEGWRTRLNGK